MYTMNQAVLADGLWEACKYIAEIELILGMSDEQLHEYYGDEVVPDLSMRTYDYMVGMARTYVKVMQYHNMYDWQALLQLAGWLHR